jgi:ribonuclease HII
MLFPPLAPIDDEFRREGYSLLAGVDEAGRGPLAGPVFAAAVILPPDSDLPRLLDSKRFNSARRIQLHDEILSVALSWHLTRVENNVIDEINILQATMRAMAGAVNGLCRDPDLVILDGIHSPSLRCPVRTLRKGDTISQSVGAASILAKVQRDRAMIEYDRTWPYYGFERHKGYGTPEHLEAIARYGPCPIHRKSFSGVREYIK